MPQEEHIIFSSSRYSLGKIVQVNAGPHEKATEESNESLYADPHYSGAKCKLSKLKVDKGMTWDIVFRTYCSEMVPRAYRMQMELEDLNANRWALFCTISTQSPLGV